MSNNVQSHEELAEGVTGGERRSDVRHTARSLGSVTARIIGGSQVDLVNFSSRGVLFECDSRLLIGARASVRITTTDANLVVTGRVVRSRVKGLVDGALRYDAALVLDKELGLAPAILADAVPAAADDDLVAFESDFDPSFDPSPVEAYLAESEASLLEVAHADLPLNLAAAAEPTTPAAEGTPVAASDPPVPADDSPVEVAAEAGVEPIAFEAEGEIAFEAAVEFAFDESGDAPFEFVAAELETTAAVPADAVPAEGVEPSSTLIVEPMVADEPAATSMFDATYIAPVYESETTESQFDVTPPTPVQAAAASSFFDPQPSEAYGEAPVEPLVAAAAEGDVAALDASDGIDFESDVAFEAADPVFEPLFEASLEPALEPSFEATLEPSFEATLEPSFDLAATDVPPAADDLTPAEALDAPTLEAAADADIEPPAAAPDADRVLLQFAATVPHDLAELRRIAADNQW
jgi:hypothetical protein